MSKVRWYRPRRRADLIRHLIENHKAIRIDPKATSLDLTAVHDDLHREMIVQPK